MKLNLGYVIRSWPFDESEAWTPDSTTRIAWEMNIKSIPGERFSKISEGFLIKCYIPIFTVTASILELSYVV